MNVSAAGKSYPDVTFTVDPARVNAFRGVFGEPAGVPATFVTAAEFTVLPTIVADPEVDLDFTRVLHGSQEYELRRPLVVGETLTVRTRIDSIRVRGGNGFLVIVTELIGADGERAGTARSTMIERGAA
jgi:acyl dehydratase